MSDEIVLIQNLIYEIRGQKVMLDSDLARLYGIETRELKQAVRRNLKRFPADFMIELDLEESTFDDETWGTIYKEVKTYFPDLSVVGWFLSRMGFSTEVNDMILKLHIFCL